MPTDDWIDAKYRLMQGCPQPGDADLFPAPVGCTMLIATFDAAAQRHLPLTPCPAPADQVAPDGTRWCDEHFEREWVHPCCGRLRTKAPRAISTWGIDDEFAYQGSDYCFCADCSASWSAQMCDLWGSAERGPSDTQGHA
jgi:hypothetical protein